MPGQVIFEIVRPGCCESAATLYGNSVTEAKGARIVAGTNLEIHLASLLAGNSLKRPKHFARANRRAHHHIEKLKIAAIAKLHESLNGVLSLWIRRICSKEEFVAVVLPIDDKVSIPVGFADQLAAPHRLGDDGGDTIPADRLEKRAGFSLGWNRNLSSKRYNSAAEAPAQPDNSAAQQRHERGCGGIRPKLGERTGWIQSFHLTLKHTAGCDVLRLKCH